MREEGIVKSVSGGLCEVVMRRKTACGDNCASCGGACRMNYQIVTAKNPLGAKAGDGVIIEMESSKVLLSAFLVYILRLLVFIMSFYSIQKIYNSDKLAFSVSIILMSVVFAITVSYDRRHKEDFLPTVIKISENA